MRRTLPTAPLKINDGLTSALIQGAVLGQPANRAQQPTGRCSCSCSATLVASTCTGQLVTRTRAGFDGLEGRLMDVEWDMVSAIGMVAAAVISLGGLGFVGWQIKQARKTADLQSLQEFVRSTAEREAALVRAPDSDALNQAFFELVNHLEMHAAALNGHLHPMVSQAIVREKLRDAVIMIEEAPAWHDRLNAAISTPTTLEHLVAFVRRERAEIDKLKRARAALRAEWAEASP